MGRPPVTFKSKSKKKAGKKCKNTAEILNIIKDEWNFKFGYLEVFNKSLSFKLKWYFYYQTALLIGFW